jgi:secondary thiamine-phosphate synthase enzyme
MLHQDQLQFQTPGRGTLDITAKVQQSVRAAACDTGVATIFVHHTSASLILCENADPQVRRDLEAWLYRAVPDGDSLFKHIDEGADDMPAHVRSVLTATSLAIPIRDGHLDLGTWQGLYLYEHRTAPHRRRVSVTVIGAS